jgi:hypothetical protein
LVLEIGLFELERDLKDHALDTIRKDKRPGIAAKPLNLLVGRVELEPTA